MSVFMRLGSLCAAVVAIGIVTAVVAAQQPRDTVGKPTIGTALIIGTVVTDEPTPKPIRRATVTLAPATSGLTISRSTTTDDAGRFAFPGLPAGNYSAPRASKPGLVSSVYGEKRTGGIGVPITLIEGQRLTIALKMLRGAVITGTLVDQGRPIPQTSVQATQVRIINGVQTANQYAGGGSAQTDDRGTYRIYGLAPGDYVVAAAPRFLSSGELRPVTEDEVRWAEQQLQPQGSVTYGSNSAAVQPTPRSAQAVAYTPVYYPGTTNSANATVVTVTAGQERPGVDFGVQFVATSRIDGTVVDENGQPAQSAQINLVSTSESSTMLDPFFMMDSMMMSRPTVTDGKFSLAGVRPGTYTLAARAVPRAAAGAPPGGRGGAPPPMTLWASADITVDGADVSGIALRLQPGMDISGRVVFEGTTLQPPADLSRVAIRLSSAPNPSGMTVSVNVPSATATADGSFTLQGVTPGRYFLSASAPAQTLTPGMTWLLKSARVGDVDAADMPFEVKPGEGISAVELTFTDQASELSGTLLDAAGKPTREFSIMLFATDRSMWSQRSRRLKPPVRASTDGKFKFTNLLPGEYYLAALTDFEPADVYKPDFLEQVAAAAMKVTIASGEKKVQDLKIAGGLR